MRREWISYFHDEPNCYHRGQVWFISSRENSSPCSKEDSQPNHHQIYNTYTSCCGGIYVFTLSTVWKFPCSLQNRYPSLTLCTCSNSAMFPFGHNNTSKTFLLAKSCTYWLGLFVTHRPNSPSPLTDNRKVMDESSINFMTSFFFIFC